MVAAAILYSADALIIGIFIIAVAITAALQYCVYLYYADLKKENLHLRHRSNLPNVSDNLYSVGEGIEKKQNATRIL